MDDIMFPLLTFSGEGKQPLEKVIASFSAAAETCGWRSEKKNAVNEGIWNTEGCFKEECYFHADSFICMPLAFDVTSEIDKLLSFEAASKNIDSPRLGKFDIRIWLQPFHLRKGYDSVEIYLAWSRPNESFRMIFLSEIYQEFHLEIVTFLRSFKDELLSTKVINEMPKSVSK